MSERLVPLYEFWFLDYGAVYLAAGLMAEDGSHLSQRGKQILPRSNGQGSLRGLYKQDVQGKGMKCLVCLR